jgi:hypothetical protein
MGNVLGVLFFIVVAIIIAGIIWLHFYFRKIRRQKLAAIAQHLGLTYYPGGYCDLEDRYDFFELFQRGGNRHSYDLIAGHIEEVEVMLFDFSYTTGSGKNRTTHRRTACVLEVPTHHYFPYVIIRPESFFDKIASAVGFNDIDFESVEFSKKYFVKSKDRRFAYDIIHPRMMEYLLSVGSVCIEIANRAVLVHHDTRLSPGEWVELYGRAREFLDRVPERLLSRD